jgi:predicted small lipoprotein YifL
MLPRPKFLSRFTIWALLALLASSCGLKGPLYRPDEPPTESVTPAADSSATKKKPGETTVPPPGTTTDSDRPAVPPDR